MKRLLAAAVFLTAACTGVPASREMPDNCDYPGSSVQCRGLHPG